MAGNRRLSKKRFKELVLYLCRKSEKDTAFDEEKLKILLFFCDFNAYAKLGKSITGAMYWKE